MMRVHSRILAIVLLAGGTVALLTWLAGPAGADRADGAGPGATGPAAVAPGTAGAGTTRSAPGFQSSADCRGCHLDVWNEWHGSQHQVSYLNPEVRALSDDFRNKECQACHLPRPVSVTGFGQRVLARHTHPDEGVSCLSCHQDVDGTILGRNDRPDVPCKARRSEPFLSVDMCASCHNQHKTTDQWRESRYAREGTDCNGCHMPEVGRSGGRKGRGHRYPGGHDLETLRRAGRFELTLEGREAVLSLSNVGAGHSYPTEERSRALDMAVRFRRQDGSATEWQRAHRFRQPYRDEPEPDTQLPAGQTHAVRVPLPDDAVKVEARLWYRRTPFVGDDDPRSMLLEERSAEVR